MFKRPFSSNQILFFGSILLPYLLDLFPNHSAGTHNLVILFYDFIALMTLGISSLVLALGTAELRSNGKGLVFLVIAFMSVALYFYSLDARIGVRELVEFFFRKSEVEAYAAQYNQVQPAADDSNTEHRYSPDNNLWYSKLPSGIIVYNTEAEASVYSGGYAYSPADKKPLNGDYYEWRRLSGHWYKWKRHEG
jgi:hypothetical protein